MADLINFTLPSINENMDAKTMKQIKNYLFQLTEQMKFYLNNIDTDNFTDAYNQHLSKMATSQTTNANQMSVTQQQLKAFENNYNYSIKQAVDKISGNNGGYIVTLDTNGDGMPDDLRILADTSNYVTSKKYWQFNRAGLAYIERTNGTLTSSLALSADGYIIADRVKGNLGEFVTLNACTLNACNINACTGSFSGKINAELGEIGGWIIDGKKLYAKNGDTYATMKSNGDVALAFGSPSAASTSGANIQIWHNGRFKTGYNSNTNSYAIDFNPDGNYSLFGWIVDENSIYADYGIYRAYIQKPKSRTDWVFSTQEKENGEYYGTFLVQANGVMCLNRINDINGQNLIGVISGNTTVGLGDQKRDTNIYTNPDYVINMIFGTASSYFRFLKGSNDYQLQVPTNLSLFANNNKGLIYLGGNCSVDGKMKTYGDLELNFRATSGTVPLVVNSSGIITTSSSSKRYKENITENISKELDYMKVLDIPICEYNYKPEHKDKELVAGKQIGLIAEDVQKYFPNASILDKEGQAENWQDRIILSALLGVCKQQQQDIIELKERIIALEN